MLNIVSMVIMFFILADDFGSILQEHGIYESFLSFFGLRHIFMFIAVAILVFTMSSIIIDNVLNPVRQMILKVNEVSEMKFKSPLVIDESDDELREYAISFNNMAEKLNRYIRMQNRFVSDASHELATPITVINGHADLLLRRGAENPEVLKNGLTIIKAEILRMSGLVDSLLLLAKSDNGQQKYNFETVDITMLVNESVEEIKIIAPDYDFKVQASDKISARCDEYAIRRVMRILLTNAVKYAEDGKKIKVSVVSNHGLLKVSVEDNGIGIQEEHLNKIFERFYRVDTSRNKKTGSSGLGLAIAKEIINAHGGEIKVASTFGDGTFIEFTLSN